MRLFRVLKTGLLTAAICLSVQAQTAPAPAAPAKDEAKGMPPRTTPAEYQAQAKAGTFTIAAEFKGHAIPTVQGNTLTSEDYVTVEVGFFGAPDARLKLAADDFSLRINGKKSPLPSQPYGLILASVKDPEWEPPASTNSKSKTSVGGSGKEQGDNSPPPPVKVPIEVQRAMAKNVQKAVLPEGDRALPQAGLIFFQYRGKEKGINSIELIYSGPAGKATLNLQP
jgi:hypothetical protein